MGRESREHPEPWGYGKPYPYNRAVLRDPSHEAGCCDTLVVQDHAQEPTVDRQRAAARVIDEAQHPELVHEMTDP